MMFFSASSFDYDGLISDYCEEENDLRRIMRNQSKTAVFMCDSGKFGTRSAFSFFYLSEIDYLVTDKELSFDTLSTLELEKYAEDPGAVLYRRLKR